MITFIGTFGVHDSMSDRYQPISAHTEAAAAQAMERQHGTGYCAIYTADEFLQERNAGRYAGTRPLKLIGEEIA
ncbi:hypothetical protein NCCP2716_27440 [Sporosarcina sp. NCCP-2716]|uniref:hypothetical protein n=1 Tax=Sporosarcina sp. NCCP-2716 TaxID=2943679 RepID=UPI00203BC1B2|nr:hypothetical protein [Sporosarcina sp. NCCP-2716]GKV70246.1 hypothetical protein NCCP2716_27440 [Sporosarcina sp. NCCP-2716]